MLKNTFTATYDFKTEKRFMEIELKQAYSNLIHLHRFHLANVAQDLAATFLINILMPHGEPEAKRELKDFLQSQQSNPTKKELIVYLRATGHSYQKINKLTGISYTTITKYQDPNPVLMPHLSDSFEFHQVTAWNEIKNFIKVFE